MIKLTPRKKIGK